jgi:hypothetical protein
MHRSGANRPSLNFPQRFGGVNMNGEKEFFYEQSSLKTRIGGKRFACYGFHLFLLV